VDGLCSEAKEGLEANTVLGLAIEQAKDVEITLPEGEDVVVVAPSDEAFNKALAELALTPEELLGNSDLLTSVLALHLGAAPTDASTEATTVSGPEIMFMDGDDPATLADLQTADTPTIEEGDTTAAVNEVIACDEGATVLFVDSVLIPGAPAPGPAPAPADGPVPAPALTIGGLVDATCPDIKDVIASENFSTLRGFLFDAEIAGTEIDLPEGVVVIAAPTNDAFEEFLSKLDPEVAANKTIVTEILANHIATAETASESFGTTLGGAQMGFWTMMGGVGGNEAPVPTEIAELASSSENGVITDSDPVDEMANVAAAVDCADDGQYAFAIDTVLVPEKYTPEPAPAPVPASGTSPEPAPAPSSAAGVASMGFAAVIAVVAAMLV